MSELNPKPLEAQVNFYQPWILIVYSRIMLGIWEIVLLRLFLFHLHHFLLLLLFLPGELLRPKNTHYTDNKFLKCFIIFFVCDGHHGFISCHTSFWNILFHSPTPIYVNLINVLQKSWLVGLFVHFEDFITCFTQSIKTTLHKSASSYQPDMHTVQSEYTGMSACLWFKLILSLHSSSSALFYETPQGGAGREMTFHSTLSRYR